jgi:O-antigen ligase
MKSKIILYTIYLLLIPGSTLCSTAFINHSQFGFYIYAILTTGLALCFLFRTFIATQRIYWNSAIVFFALYLFFVFCHILRNNTYPDFFGGKAGIWILSFAHLLLLFAFFRRKNESQREKMCIIFSFFLITAVFQSLYAYSQLAGLTGNLYAHFAVGGTMGNPNIQAIFLSLVLVYALNELFWMKKKRKYPYLLTVSVVIILPVVVISQCRTAWLSLFVGVIAGICIRYNLFALLKKRLTWLTFLVLLGMIVLGGYKLYRFKQPSADGRLYIWKLTTRMISRNPLQGYGFNAFEKEYNLYQANYFDQLPDNEKRYDCNLYAKNAFNDFLENGLEMGISGMLLFLSIFFFAVKDYSRQSSDQKNPSAFCSLLAWIVIALFNYNQTVPFNMLFLSFVLAALTMKNSCRSFLLNKIIALKYVI